MKKKNVYFFQVALLLLAVQGFSQGSFNVKLMYWNLLNYPSTSNSAADTTLRHPYYREVIQHEVPDILVTGENTLSTATTWFVNSVMNANGNVYSKGSFINGFDTDNAIYFKTAMFTFISNTAILTDVRDINEFKIVHTLSGDTIRIYAVHLKASSGSPNDLQRALEVDSLRKVTNLLPNGSNFIVCGDFNIYGDYESAYQKLIQDNPGDDGNFVDPITMTGVWNRFSYRAFHTQSTRTTSFGGGATGGLNDRFDMILYSSAISQNTSGISFVAGSTTPVGNDGNHFDDQINLVPNTAAPANVINALYYASDHLPVTALFNFSNPNGINSLENELYQLSVFPNPAIDNFMIKFTLPKSQKVVLKITDALGRDVLTENLSIKSAGQHHFVVNRPLDGGVHFLTLFLDESQSARKLFFIDK